LKKALWPNPGSLKILPLILAKSPGEMTRTKTQREIAKPTDPSHRGDSPTKADVISGARTGFDHPKGGIRRSRPVPGITQHEVATIDVATLKPAPYNPRRIDPAAMTALTKSLERFGDVQPIVWNKRSGLVVAGHQRLKILRAKKVRQTTVVVVDLDERSERALNIALNSPSLCGEFTADLAALLAAIQRDDEVLFAQLRFAELLEQIAPRSAGDPDAAPPCPSKSRTAALRRQHGCRPGCRCVRRRARGLDADRSALRGGLRRQDPLSRQTRHRDRDVSGYRF
jgi:hypothetical protein